MTTMADHYPPSMGECDRAGHSGDCGTNNCQIYADRTCYEHYPHMEYSLDWDDIRVGYRYSLQELDKNGTVVDKKTLHITNKRLYKQCEDIIARDIGMKYLINYAL